MMKNPLKIILQRFQKLDYHSIEVLLGAARAFVLRGMGAALAFVLNVVIARLLGAEGAGLYFLALSVTSIVSVVAKMGLDNTLLRFIATGAANNDWGQVKGVYSMGLRSAGVVSFILATLCFLLAPVIAIYVFKEPSLTLPLRCMSFGIFTLSMMILLSECLKGLKLIQNSMVVSGVLYPFFALVFIWPLVTFMGAAGASIAYVLGTGLAALFGVLFWRKAISLHDEKAIPFSREVLNASSRPLWVLAIVNRALIPWVPLFLLGVWGTVEDTGIFGAVTRVSMLVSFFLIALNTILAPKFAELYARNDIKTLGRLARQFAVFITFAASPFLLLLIFRGEWVMQLFGPEFTRGGGALAVLAVGQATNTLTGSVGYLLIMSGYETDVRTSSLISVLVLFLLAAVLIPSAGLMGAAIASAGAVVLNSFIPAYFVWKRLGICIVPGFTNK